MKLRSCHPHLACVLIGGSHTSAYLTCGMEKSVIVRVRPRIGGGGTDYGVMKFQVHVPSVASTRRNIIAHLSCSLGPCL